LPICVVARKKVNAKKKDAHFILVGLEVPAVDQAGADLSTLLSGWRIKVCIFADTCMKIKLKKGCML
jgi:hypothetical protein